MAVAGIIIDCKIACKIAPAREFCSSHPTEGRLLLRFRLSGFQVRDTYRRKKSVEKSNVILFALDSQDVEKTDTRATCLSWRSIMTSHLGRTTRAFVAEEVAIMTPAALQI
jgi:hypothetical protein